MQYPFDVHSSMLIAIFKPFTILGGVSGSILVLALLFWLIDHRVAVKIASALVLSNLFNSLLKFVIQQPRPSGVQYDTVSGSGMPSGHAQNSVVMYGLLAMYYKRKTWVIGISVFLSLMIGLSRIVLNVHTTEQVLVGWFVGIIVMLVFYVFYEKYYEPRKNTIPDIAYLIGAIIIPLLLALIVWLFHESEEALHGSLVTIAAIFGLWIGYYLLMKYVPFGRPNNAIGGFTRVLLGFPVLFIVLLGLSVILKPLGAIGSYIKYFFVGLMVSFVIPWIFERFEMTKSSFS